MKKNFVLLVLIALVGMSGVVSASVTYDGTRIIISNGIETLTSINQTLNDQNLLEEISIREWLLKKPIWIESTATLNINDIDCDWLKLQSLNDSNVVYIKNKGVLNMENTKITSWNSLTNNFAPKTDNTRSYIYSQGSQLKAVSCNLSWLGAPLSPKHEEYGLATWDSNGALLQDLILSNNWIGLEVSTDNSIIKDCQVFHNAYYGISVGYRHFPVSGLRFENITIYENGNANFITQFTWDDIYVLENSEIINMTSHTGYGNLITIRRSRNVTIKDSKAYGSGYKEIGGPQDKTGDWWHSCFDIHSYHDNILVDNCEAWDCQTPFFTHNWNTDVTFKNCIAHDVIRGFEIQGGCTNNRIENCTAYNINGYAFRVHSSSNNYVINCIAYNSTIGGWFFPFN